MRKYLSPFLAFLLFSIATVSISFADPAFPVDSDGDLLPSPTGNLNYIRLPSAMAADNIFYTWTYLGTLNAMNQESLSFQGVITGSHGSSKDNPANESIGVGFHSLQLGFKEGDINFYANSAYGGEDNIAQALFESIDTIRSKATLNDFYVKTYSLFNSSQSPVWQVRSISSNPQFPLFKGLIGQPGHEYQLNGSGQTFLWRYASDGHATIQKYRYTLELILLDERGVVAEGFGGAYVGPPLVKKPKFLKPTTVLAEHEIGLPRLKVTKWSIHLQAMNPSSLSDGFKPGYQWSGQDGMLWSDIGPLLSQPAVNALKHLPDLIKQYQPSFSDHFSQVTTNDSNQSWSLYNGNWLTIQFTKGKYKGASLVFVPFWNKMPIDPSDYPTTDDPAWCVDGWADLYTGIIDNDVSSANTVPEILIPGNPEPATVIPTGWKNPFTIKYLQMANSQKYGLLFPWVQKLEITIQPYSQIRYMLAAFAHKLNPDVIDNPAEPITLIITAFSPITENIYFTKKWTQAYEGAATATLNNEFVGPAWIEEMVGSSS